MTPAVDPWMWVALALSLVGIVASTVGLILTTVTRRRLREATALNLKIDATLDRIEAEVIRR